MKVVFHSINSFVILRSNLTHTLLQVIVYNYFMKNSTRTYTIYRFEIFIATIYGISLDKIQVGIICFQLIFHKF